MKSKTPHLSRPQNDETESFVLSRQICVDILLVFKKVMFIITTKQMVK